MGYLPPSSSHPLPGHLSESYLPLMRRKQVNLGDLVPSGQLGAAQEGLHCGKPGISPGVRGRSSLAGPLCSRGPHFGSQRLAWEEWGWQ